MRINSYAPFYLLAMNDSHHFIDVPEHATIECEGCYKGEREGSFLMSADAFRFYDLPRLLEADGQESVLFLDNQRGAWLFYREDGYAQGAKTVYLGEFKQVPASVALAREAWTKDPQGRYWVAG